MFLTCKEENIHILLMLFFFLKVYLVLLHEKFTIKVLM